MKREEGLALAKRYAAAVRKSGLPIIDIYVYGSVANGNVREGSDIDIAVVSAPFGKSRHDENTTLRRVRWDIDLRIEPISLHPEDLENRYSTIGQEVKRHGISV